MPSAPGSGGGSEDLHRLQLQVPAHLQQPHARRRDAVAEVVDLRVAHHRLRGGGRFTQAAGATAGCFPLPPAPGDLGNRGTRRPGPRREVGDVPSNLTPCPEGATRGQWAPEGFVGVGVHVVSADPAAAASLRTRRFKVASGGAVGGLQRPLPPGRVPVPWLPAHPRPVTEARPQVPMSRERGLGWKSGQPLRGTAALRALHSCSLCPCPCTDLSCRRQERAPREGERLRTPAQLCPRLCSPLHQGPGWPCPAPGGM